MTEPTILTERRDAVLIVTMNRAGRLNALTDEMRRTLSDILGEARTDGTVRAMVLTGAGRAFCSGADLRAPEPEVDESGEPIRERGRPRYTWVEEFHQMPVPVVAAVNGPAAGAGMGLALACDVRVMAEGTFLLPAFAARGLTADTGVSWMLPRLAGTGRALRWLWDAERIPAADAKEAGLVEIVVPDDVVLSEAIALAGKWAHGPTVALGQIKRQVLRLHDELVGRTVAPGGGQPGIHKGHARPQGRDGSVPRAARARIPWPVTRDGVTDGLA
jgi:2-(1,2-epoxy-1,2-dihydrophenyl)acetyl-CoA isomerase